MRKVVHFEIPADDLGRAKAFYGSVFGWQIERCRWRGANTRPWTTPTDESTQMPTEPGAINGGMMQRDETTPAPVITIDVDAIDEALKEIEASGGGTVSRGRRSRAWGRSPTSRIRRATCWVCGRPRRSAPATQWSKILTAPLQSDGCGRCRDGGEADDDHHGGDGAGGHDRREHDDLEAASLQRRHAAEDRSDEGTRKRDQTGGLGLIGGRDHRGVQGPSRGRARRLPWCRTERQPALDVIPTVVDQFQEPPPARVAKVIALPITIPPIASAYREVRAKAPVTKTMVRLTAMPLAIAPPTRANLRPLHHPAGRRHRRDAVHHGQRGGDPERLPDDAAEHEADRGELRRAAEHGKGGERRRWGAW